LRGVEVVEQDTDALRRASQRTHAARGKRAFGGV
jgi:hypothetical protein